MMSIAHVDGSGVDIIGVPQTGVMGFVFSRACVVGSTALVITTAAWAVEPYNIASTALTAK